MLKMAKEANISDPRINAEIDKRIYETITEEYIEDMMPESEGEEEMEEEMETVEQERAEHPPVTSIDNLIEHLRSMVAEGYTDEQIKELHPELAQLFNRGV